MRWSKEAEFLQVVVVFSFLILYCQKTGMVPQKKAALYEIYTRHKQTNKQANNQPHTHTHIKLNAKEAWSKQKEG